MNPIKILDGWENFGVAGLTLVGLVYIILVFGHRILDMLGKKSGLNGSVNSGLLELAAMNGRIQVLEGNGKLLDVAELGVGYMKDIRDVAVRTEERRMRQLEELEKRAG